MLLGGLLAFGLSGCVNMQVIVYWRLYCENWRDGSLVIVTWLLDLCHSALVAITLWVSIIMPYGDADRDWIPWSVGPSVELTAMITLIVQSFFALRIYKLQKKRLSVVIPIVVLSCCRLVTATISMGEILRLHSYTAFLERPFSSWIFTLGLILSAFVDIIITTVLCYFLHKNRTVFAQTNRMIDTLTIWTIQNGSITCAAAIAALVCWKVMPHNRIFLGIHFVVAKLYANTLLATLNARKQLRTGGKQYHSSHDHPVPIVFLENFTSPPEPSRSQCRFSESTIWPSRSHDMPYDTTDGSLPTENGKP